MSGHIVNTLPGYTAGTVRQRWQKLPTRHPFGRILGYASFTPHSLIVMRYFRKLSLYVRTGEFEDKFYIFHQQVE